MSPSLPICCLSAFFYELSPCTYAFVLTSHYVELIMVLLFQRYQVLVITHIHKFSLIMCDLPYETTTAHNNRRFCLLNCNDVSNTFINNRHTLKLYCSLGTKKHANANPSTGTHATTGTRICKLCCYSYKHHQPPIFNHTKAAKGITSNLKTMQFPHFQTEPLLQDGNLIWTWCIENSWIESPRCSCMIPSSMHLQYNVLRNKWHVCACKENRTEHIPDLSYSPS